jgi:hypothetical protein
MPNPYLVHSDTLAGQGGQGGHTHWADLEPELHEQILRLAQPAPTATVAFEDFCPVREGPLRGVNVPVEIKFEFTKAHSQRLGPASQLLWLRAYHRTTRIAPRLRITVSRRVDSARARAAGLELPPEEVLKKINAAVHYNNIAKIRLHEVAFDRYSFQFFGASQLQSYHAPDWALWSFRVFALSKDKFTEDLGMAFSQAPRTATCGPLLEYAYDTCH